MVVKRLTTFVAMALMLVWVPATSLCLMENAGILTSNGCCDESSASDDSACCALASAAYKLDDNGKPITFGTVCLTIAVILSDCELEPISPLVIINGSPPELGTTWQFFVRAAANPRAPSFVS